MGELGVLEADAEALLAEGDAHQEVDQQAGQSGARRDPHREDRKQRDRSPHEHEAVELVDVEGQGHLRAQWPAGTRSYRSAASPSASVGHTDSHKTGTCSSLGAMSELTGTALPGVLDP